MMHYRSTRSSGKSKKWFVVGGAGFIGSNLCRRLLALGDDVVCVDNMITGRPQNIKDLSDNGMRFFLSGAVEFVKSGWLMNFPEPDGIFYLASIASPKNYLKHPMKTIEANTIGLKAWLDVARSMKCPLIYTSTSEIYGDPDRHAQQESYNGNVNPQGRRAVYDESKRLGETYCSLYSREGWCDTKVVRIFNTYGPGMDPKDGRVLPNFIGQALSGEPLLVYGDGKQTRSFCYVDDMVEALVRVGDADKLPTMNLGNSLDHMTILQLAEKVRDAINPDLDIICDEDCFIEGDPRQRRPMTTLAQRCIQWKATTGFDKGLEKTIEYFKELRNVEGGTERRADD